MYQVLIVEDDPMVAAIDRQYVEKCGNFTVAGMFKNGIEALAYLEHNTADLIVLDYYTPGMNGLEFVDRLHALGNMISIVMVTSANDTCIIQGLLSRGVLDYLVKPFEYARFKQAMDKFLETKRLLDSNQSQLDQQAIDRLTLYREPAAQAEAQLTKGLSATTLSLIRSFLTANTETAFTSEQIADQVHLSRITIRRYVNHLMELGEVVSTINYQTGGRPSIRYCYVSREGEHS